ncbi:DUF975 family protein [Bacillus sp. RG28]|uniref:DUF975 family protein n=1 Tax=Gottfriedia endophytica TaxID=2820819 RepID=A0A940SJJ7_9BACI|nr:DUF975 family protein [Gottfriedia endophytica]MBP0724308.1 DUF975 family protein [Gottfriedia endophytica]
MQISSLKRQAKDSLDGFWFRTIGIVILSGIIQFIVRSGLSVLAGTVTNEGIIFNPIKLDLDSSIIVEIFSMLFNMVLGYGITVYFIRLTRGENPGVKELFYYFASGRKSIKVIITQVLVTIFTILWSILSIIPWIVKGYSFITIILTLVLIIPGIIKGIAYMLTPYIIYDNPEISPLQAITLSRRMMDGYKWKAFLIVLSFIGWFLLVCFTFLLAALFVAPYYTTTHAEFYNEVKNTYENKE